MSAEQKYEAAQQAALGYLEAAGYTIENGKAVAAPEGAKMSYEMMIGADGKGDHPSFGIIADAKKSLGEIGIELIINDLSDAGQLYESMSAHTTELMAAAWQQMQILICIRFTLATSQVTTTVSQIQNWMRSSWKQEQVMTRLTENICINRHSIS